MNIGKKIIILVLAINLVACAGFKPNIYIPKKQPVAVKPNKQPRIVLVLGSGGARGYAHLGVLQALQQAHIPIDAIVCASAGCVVGALYADSENPKKTYDAMMSAGFWTFADIGNFPSIRGLITGYHLEKFLMRNMHARTFNKLKLPLTMATTNLKTGKTYAISGGPVPPAAVASSALPGAVRPVHLYGYTLVDGGVAAPVPVQLAKRHYHGKMIIAVNIAEQMSPHIPLTALSVYHRAYSIMWQHLTNESVRGADIIIHPQVGRIGTFDLNEKYPMYLAGYRAGEKMVPRIRQLMKEKHIQ